MPSMQYYQSCFVLLLICILVDAELCYNTGNTICCRCNGQWHCGISGCYTARYSKRLTGSDISYYSPTPMASDLDALPDADSATPTPAPDGEQLKDSDILVLRGRVVHHPKLDVIKLNDTSTSEN